MSDRVNLILGPPGTGKTTAVLDRVDALLAAGTKPERIALVSFTRKAADEAAQRAAERFGVDRKMFRFFRTAHSLCFQQLALSREQVMGTAHYRQIGDALGLTFTGAYDDLDAGPLSVKGQGVGDLAMRVEALARLRMRGLREQWADMAIPDLPWLVVDQYARTLTAYKRDTGMLDFTDMLERFDFSVPVDEFIIDEAQDNSAAVWRALIRAARDAQQVMIAGDDDQAIFRWAGADIGFFLSLRGRRTVLPVSHRLPKSIFLLADRIISRVENRYAKSWRPRDEVGSIEYINDPAAAPLGNGETWMLLARNLYLLDRLERVVRDAGQPYLLNGASSTDTHATRAIIAWENLRKGGVATPEEARQIARFSSRATITSRGLESYSPAALGVAGQMGLDWMDALDLIPIEEREYIRACRRNGAHLFDPPRITVSSIHGVKGGQADNVLLLADISHRTWQAMQVNADDETRVFYVGLTRAKQCLWLVRPSSLKFFNLN